MLRAVILEYFQCLLAAREQALRPAVWVFPVSGLPCVEAAAQGPWWGTYACFPLGEMWDGEECIADRKWRSKGVGAGKHQIPVGSEDW